jgi:hypothetical protein
VPVIGCQPTPADQRDGLLDDVAQLAQVLDPSGLAARDDRLGAAFTARVREQDAEAAAGRPRLPAKGG